MRFNERQFIKTLNKVPQGSIHDKDLWQTYADASVGEHEAGWVVQPGYFIIDIDKHLTGDDVDFIFEHTKGCYREKSRSGQGWHIIGRCDPIEHSCKHTGLKLELYTAARQVVITQTEAKGDPETHVNLKPIVDKYFPHSSQKQSKKSGIPKHVESFLLSRPDRRALLEGDASAYNGDISAAELALCSQAAFAAKGNVDDVRETLLNSGFAREKHLRNKYVEDTVKLACSNYSESSNAKGLKVDCNFAPEDMWPTIFDGLAQIFISASFIDTKGNSFNKESFNSKFSNYVFEFRGKSISPYNAALKMNLPKGNNAVFNPNYPLFAKIEDDINIYKPAVVERKAGDVTPLLNHLKWMISDDHDRNILINYLAACVQRPGRKYSWAPVLMGAQGNGKSMILNLTGEAVGEEYFQRPNASKLDTQFNGWMQRALFIHLEEANFAHDPVACERMKTYITSSVIASERKGKDEIQAKNFANFALSTNNADSIPKRERRYCMILTDQQSKLTDEEKAKVDEVATWVKANKPIVYNWLHTLEIDPFYDPMLSEYAKIPTNKIQGGDYTTIERILLECVEHATTLEEVQANFKMKTGKYKDKTWLNINLKNLGVDFE